MTHHTLVYTPTSGLLWLRVLVREFMIPRTHWFRLLAGPVLLVMGLIGMGYCRYQSYYYEEDYSGMNLMSSVLVGVGLGWSSWPLAAAWLSVLRNVQRRKRQPIRLTLTAGVIELVSGDSRRLFPLDDLQERMKLATGEFWLRFRGDRYLLIPAEVSEGDVETFLATVFDHEPEAAPPPILMAPGRLTASGRQPPVS